MRIGADTYFLILLANRDQQAEELFRQIINGEHELILSTLSITELASVLYRRGRSELVEKLKTQLIAFPYVNIISVNLDLASEAAKRKHSLSLSVCDAVILTTALMERCDVFIAEDEDFEIAKEQGIIKIVTPKDIIL